MQTISLLVSRALGGFAPVRWGSAPTRGLLIGALALFATGCGEEEETRTLEPIQLGMTKGMTAIYEQPEMSMYEVKRPVAFPIQAPKTPVGAWPSQPSLLNSDLRIQVSWTLTNLDEETHNVELLIDPWNEFGRYWPGMTVTDVQREEQAPNLSGIDILMEVPGTKSGRPSRRHGSFTYEDMKELAIDFATALNIIATAPPPDPTMDVEENPAVGLINHAFAVENRSYNDPLIQHGCPNGTSCIPAIIPGLTGFDLGLRTYEEANVAIEILVEVVDTGSGKVVQRDENDPTLYTPAQPEPAQYITIANGGY